MQQQRHSINEKVTAGTLTIVIWLGGDSNIYYQVDPYSFIHFSYLSRSSLETLLLHLANASRKSCAETGKSNSSLGICLIWSGRRPAIFRLIDIIAASLGKNNSTLYAANHKMKTSFHSQFQQKSSPKLHCSPANVGDISTGVAVQLFRDFLQAHWGVKFDFTKVYFQQGFSSIVWRGSKKTRGWTWHARGSNGTSPGD